MRKLNVNRMRKYRNRTSPFPLKHTRIFHEEDFTDFYRGNRVVQEWVDEIRRKAKAQYGTCIVSVWIDDTHSFKNPMEKKLIVHLTPSAVEIFNDGRP